MFHRVARTLTGRDAETYTLFEVQWHNLWYLVTMLNQSTPIILWVERWHQDAFPEVLSLTSWEAQEIQTYLQQSAY